MAEISDTKARLEELRDTAGRLALSSHDARLVRALVVELCDVILGNDTRQEDLDLCGARFPAPSRPTAYVAPVPLARPPAPALQVSPLPGPTSGARKPISIAEAAAIAQARREGKPLPAPAAAIAAAAPELPPLQPAPDPTVADPAGPEFLREIQRGIDREGEEGAAGAESDTTTTNQGA